MTDRKHPGGRPRSVMTPEVIADILKTVELGIWPDTAARRHGVNPSTLRSLKDSSEEFRTTLEKAEAKAEQGFHGQIMKAATGSQDLREPDETDDDGKVIKGKLIAKGRAPIWTAAAWMLERRWPARYARKEAPAIGEIHVAEGGKVEVAAGPPMPEPGDWAPYVERLAEVTRKLDEAAAKRNGAPDDEDA